MGDGFRLASANLTNGGKPENLGRYYYLVLRQANETNAEELVRRDQIALIDCGEFGVGDSDFAA